VGIRAQGGAGAGDLEAGFGLGQQTSEQVVVGEVFPGISRPGPGSATCGIRSGFSCCFTGFRKVSALRTRARLFLSPL
jgi:hypothetical protein